MNELTGTIPPIVLTQLTNLKVLHLYSNNFIGTIPTEIGLLTQLSVLSLGSNRFTGTIPKEAMTQLSSIIRIGVEFTNITGNVNPIFCDMGDVYDHVTNTTVIDATKFPNLSNLKADCGGPDPTIICDCCSVCMQPTW